MSRIYLIGVDARPLTAPMSGVARVISSVLRYFPERERFHFVLYANRPWHPDFADLMALPGVEWVQGDGMMAGRAGLWFNFRLPALLRQCPVDLFWGSQQVIPPGLSRGYPVVLTCYDLVSYFYPDTMRPLARMQQRAVMRLSMRRADRILAISTQTRDDVVHEFDYPLDQAGVALLGYEMPETPEGEEREQLQGEVALRLGFRPRENYILAVSTIEPRKNYGTLLDAYMEYYRRVGLRAYPLVIAGRRGWETPEFYRKLEDYQRECGRIYNLEGLSDRHLGELYRCCAFFCMPSLYEGFGLPLLEALCNGRIALASDIPCFHEIGGDVARYLPTGDVAAWAQALEDCTANTLASRGKKKPPAGTVFPVKEWSWDRTAATYRRVFLKLLEPVAAIDAGESPMGGAASGNATAGNPGAEAASSASTPDRGDASLETGSAGEPSSQETGSRPTKSAKKASKTKAGGNHRASGKVAPGQGAGNQRTRAQSRAKKKPAAQADARSRRGTRGGEKGL